MCFVQQDTGYRENEAGVKQAVKTLWQPVPFKEAVCEFPALTSSIIGSTWGKHVTIYESLLEIEREALLGLLGTGLAECLHEQPGL